MNTYAETKDTITLTTNSVSVGQGSFIQLRLRSKRQTPIRMTCNGEEYQIQSGSVTPMLDGTVVVYKDSTESEVFIERSTYKVSTAIDKNEGFVTEETNPLTGGIRLSAAGRSFPLYGQPKAHYVKPTPGLLIGSASALTDSMLQLCASPVKYSAVRIGYMHAGGYGATVGTVALVGATDNVGTRDFADIANATFKKVVSPKSSGTEYNTVKSDGTAGWRQVTWGGASSKAMPDAGANKVGIVWSDLVQVEGTVDANGMYPLLVRLYHGTGPYTRIAALTGMQTAANYATDVLSNYCLNVGRSGDSVTTPANWSEANSTYVVGGLPIIVEFLAADDVSTVMFVGDSRFAVSSELSATKQYLSVESLFGNAQKADGMRIATIGFGASGAASSAFEPVAAAAIDAGAVPDVAVYLAWTVNDGSPTTALTAIAKYRMLEFASKCGQYGIRPLIVTAFPTSAGFTAGELLALADIKTLALSITSDVLDPLALYGNVDGTWKSGYAFDGNHMTQSGYADFVAKLGAII